MSSLVATPDLDNAAVAVVIDDVYARDTFTRTVSNGWGTADTGQTWTIIEGTAADFAVNGTLGTMTHSATNASHSIILPPSRVDVDVRINVEHNIGSVAGGNLVAFFDFRMIDINNLYRLYVRWKPAGVATVELIKLIAGTSTTIAGETVIPGVTATSSLTVRVRVTGTVITGVRLLANAWLSTQPEPAWLLSAVDFTFGALGDLRVASFRDTGNTNNPTVFRFDNLTVAIPEPVHVSRVYPNATEAEVLGSPFYTSGGLAVLWDTVMPLDVPVFYVARADGSTVISLTSNTVTVTGQGDGWLRDPEQPIYDVHLVDCSRSCPITVSLGVVSRQAELQALDPAALSSANGTFPIIDAARSRTVSQTRKARSLALHILTMTLAQEQGVVNVLASGRVLFLQLAHLYGWAYDNWASDYVDVGDVVDARVGTQNMLLPQRTWSLPLRLARAPTVTSGHLAGNGIGVSGTTYGDGTASGRTYQDRINLPNTYLDTSLGVGL
jgi:hypothetical protein